MVIVFVGFNPGKECVAAQMVVEHRDLVEELDFLCEAGYFKIAFFFNQGCYISLYCNIDTCPYSVQHD